MNKQLSVNYSIAGLKSTDEYWIRIEQDVVDEKATVRDAANLLDALYNIEACEEEGSDQSGEEQATEQDAEDISQGPVVEEEAFFETVNETLGLGYCEEGEDGSLIVEIRVVRSHLGEPYKLRVQGGAQKGTPTIVKEVREVRQEIQAVMVLPWPVVDRFSCSPAPIDRNGNTLRFAESLVGGTVVATYVTMYDKVQIKIKGVDGKPGECTVLAFHHGIVDEKELEVPDADDEDRSLCNASAHGEFDTDYKVTCYKDIHVTTRCSCSRKEVGSRTVQQVVPCPREEMRCPNNAKECMHLVGSEAIDEWVECSNDNSIPGRPGEVYAVSKPSYYEKVCCKPPGNITLPQCKVKKTTYGGGQQIEHGQDYWRGIYGESTRFYPVTPAAGICGEWTIEQVVTGDCCDTASPIVYDWARSVDVIADNNSGVIFWSGGLGPYRLTVIEGTGFWLNSAKTSRTISSTNAQYAYVFTSNACGGCRIIIEDSCGQTAEAQLRSPDGRWVQMLASWMPSVSMGGCAWVTGCEQQWCAAESTRGIYKTRKQSASILMHTSGCVAPVQPLFSNQFFANCPTYPISKFNGAYTPAIGHDPGNCNVPGLNQPGPTNQTLNPFSNIYYWMSYCSAKMYFPGLSWDVWEWRC